YCSGASDCLDATHSGRDAAFADYHERTDIAGRGHMSAAAQLHAEVRYRHDTNPVAVFFPEERHRTGRNGFLGWPDLGLHRHIAINVLVDDVLDAFLFLRGHRLKMDEIEAQPIGRHERSFLLDVTAEDFA